MDDAAQLRERVKELEDALIRCQYGLRIALEEPLSKREAQDILLETIGIAEGVEYE